MKDLDFVQRCVKGDKRAWDEFLKQYSRLIYNYIYSVFAAKVGACAQNHIDDIFHDIICSLIEEDYKRLRSFKAKNGSSLASWLRQVTINFTLRYIGKLSPAVSIDEVNEEKPCLKDALADDSAPIPDIIVGAEEIQVLTECVELLSSKEKLILEFNLHRGVKLEALKDILKVTRGALDMQKARLLEKLRDCFKGKGFALDF